MTALHLAKIDNLDKLLPMVAAFHQEDAVEQSNEGREAALRPLLEGSPHGAVYIIGPVRAPIGYIIVSFGWSIELGGLDGFVDELYIRPAVRRRGIASEVLMSLPKVLADAGLKALHLEVDRTNTAAQALYRKLGFRMRDRYHLMSRRL